MTPWLRLTMLPSLAFTLTVLWIGGLANILVVSPLRWLKEQIG